MNKPSSFNEGYCSSGFGARRLGLQDTRVFKLRVNRVVPNLDLAAFSDILGERLQLAGFDRLVHEHAAAAVGMDADRAERLLRGGAEEGHAGGSDAVDFDPRFVELVVHYQLDLATRFFVLPCGLESLHVRHSNSV